MLIQNKHLPIPSEAEISRTPIHQNTTQQDTPGRPNRDSITAAAVHVAVEVAFYTIGDTHGSHGEETAVGQEGLAVVICYVEGVAIRIALAS